jgi:hypothetical protein
VAVPWSFPRIEAQGRRCSCRRRQRSELFGSREGSVGRNGASIMKSAAVAIFLPHGGRKERIARYSNGGTVTKHQNCISNHYRCISVVVR